MLISKYFIPTLKEDPSEAVAISHKLMIRASLIRKVSAGLYAYLPLGQRIFLKVSNIIRKEMNRAGAQEFSFPILTPAELWQESGRWQEYGPELIRIKDRNEHWNALGPTHEEVFTAIVRSEITSYKQLPVNFYQMKTKFRDEIRPRYGVIRSKEFTMKDAYSFDIDEKSLDISYNKMRVAYANIFKRCGINTVIVEADNGPMGGTQSEEFMVVSDIGEATLVICDKCGYAADNEKAESIDPYHPEQEKQKPMELVDTPNQKTIEELTAFLKTDPKKFIKTILYLADEKPIAVLIRGDLEINEIKLRNALHVSNLELAGPEIIKKITHAVVGFAGPVKLDNIPIYADLSIKTIVNGITGANQNNKHLSNVNIDRDFKVASFFDIRTVKENDLCIKCNSPLHFKKGIEVGQIFKLGYKYTKSMNVKFLDEGNKEKHPIMGCYGIGVDRTIASVIEQSYDTNGIIFPITIAPFELMIIPIIKDNKEYKQYVFALYEELNKHYEVLMDDRDVSPGFKFKDADLIGIPIKLILSERNLNENKIEIKKRKEGKSILVDKDNIIEEVKKIIKEEYKKYES